MSRAVSPQGRRRIRTVIGRSNRRQVVNPFDGTFEVTRSTPTPGLDGTFYDGDLKSFLNATQQNNNSFSRAPGEEEDEGPVGPGLPLPNNPGRSSTALSMNTIGNATICSLRQEEVSMEWANATGGYFEDTLGPDGGPRRSQSSMSHSRAGRATPWRKTDVTSVSATLSANPENTKERLTFATRRERLKNPPTALDLLNSLTKERRTHESVSGKHNATNTSALGLGGVTPGPMVFDDPKFMDCPTVPNGKMNSVIAKQLNGANDGKTATKGSSKADKDLSVPQNVGAGFCSNGAWVMKKQHHSPARGGATADGDGGVTHTRHQNSLLAVTNNSSPLRSRIRPSDVLSHVPSITAPPKLRQERTRYGGTEHMVQAPKNAAGATYLAPAQQFTAVNRGLGASLEAQEKKLRSLAAQQRRVERHAESEHKAHLHALATERRDADRALKSLERKSNIQRNHEVSSKESHFRIQPPNSYEALMDP